MCGIVQRIVNDQPIAAASPAIPPLLAGNLRSGKDQNVNLRVFRPSLARKRRPVIAVLAALATTASLGVAAWGGAALAASNASARAAHVPGAATGLGQLSGILPTDKLTLPSAIEVNLTHEFVRLPIYPGIAYAGTSHQEKVWFILEDASTQGAADDLGLNFAPKLANMAIGCPQCVQTVHLINLPASQNHFGPAPISFAGAPNFSPTRIAVPGPDGFPLAKFQPGAVAGPGYSPFIRIAGSDTIYNAPIIATGNGPYDVVNHTNTADRVLGIHIGRSPADSPSGSFSESWVDMLFVKGFDGSEPIVYLSTDAGQPLTAVLERSTYVPALNNASCNGCDDFLGSARERLFGFINGQTGVNNPQAQGFQHLAKDGMVSKNAVQSDTKFINALRYGGDLLNVFGDFPTLLSPRHADAYSPLWDAQLALWTPKAIKEGLDKRQINEDEILNLAFSHPDLLTGVNPATGQPQLYGSVGVDINCAVIGYTARAPTTPGPPNLPGSQFPPR
jgi:hypothetical protein